MRELTPRGSRLQVWGDPIAHSKSPQLHSAAYQVLGLDWSYTRRQVSEESFESQLATLDESWRGLSLTMPLKDSAFRAAGRLDRHAEITGSVNTLLFGGELAGFNTDVGGIVDALADVGVSRAARVRILGAGATAASALAAAAELGAVEVEVRARRPDRGARIAAIGERLGIPVTLLDFDAPFADRELTIGTLPGGAALPADTARSLADHGGFLFDVAYAPWPSTLAAHWDRERAISGLGMLLRQAVRQIRVFVHGDPEAELSAEVEVVAAMRAAL